MSHNQQESQRSVASNFFSYSCFVANLNPEIRTIFNSLSRENGRGFINMARATLVSGSSIGVASLPETIIQEELPITISTENKLEICKSNTQEVRINAPTIPSDLTSSHAATWPESGKLITFEEIEQELHRVVLLNPPGYYRPTGLPINHHFYDYVYLSSKNGSGHRLMGIFNRAEQAYPAINGDQCRLGLLEWLGGPHIPSQ